MKFHKLISRTIVATALLGTTFGGVFSGIKANASGQDSDTQGDSTKSDVSQMIRKSNGSITNSTITDTRVKDGFLTLDSVPKLSFGNSSDNNSNQANQPATFSLNSQNNGILRITDYRNIDKNNDNSDNSDSGWQLNATIDKFSNTDSNYNGNPIDQDNWTMHLNNNKNYHNLDVDSGNSEASKANFNTQSLSTNGSNSGMILDSTNHRQNSNDTGKGYGINEINYNNPNDASLDIPNVPQGMYTTNVNWSLSTPLNSYNTDSDNE